MDITIENLYIKPKELKIDMLKDNKNIPRLPIKINDDIESIYFTVEENKNKKLVHELNAMCNCEKLVSVTLIYSDCARFIEGCIIEKSAIEKLENVYHQYHIICIDLISKFKNEINIKRQEYLHKISGGVILWK